MAKLKPRGPTKADRKLSQERDMEKFLRRVGYKESNSRDSVNEIPDYKTNNYHITSNAIPGNGSKVRENSYSGIEILGIATMHKSNLMPIRKDNPQAAIDSAQMRRN